VRSYGNEAELACFEVGRSVVLPRIESLTFAAYRLEVFACSWKQAFGIFKCARQFRATGNKIQRRLFIPIGIARRYAFLHLGRSALKRKGVSLERVI
jgi:hypothetical protein